ncbi:MAG: DUF748 domain-containing protein, partial [Cyanobacteria bacterium J06627_8]
MDTVPNDTHEVFRRPVARVGVTFAGLALVTGGAGGIWVSDYVETNLAPAIAQDLSESLRRPVELGDATSFSPTHIRFGPSNIPATETDADTLDVDAIIVRFSLLDLWRDGDVPLSVTLVRPDIQIDQNHVGHWLETEVDFAGESRFPVQTVRLRDADIWLEPIHEEFDIHPRAIDYLSRRQENQPSHHGINLVSSDGDLDPQALLDSEFSSNSTIHLQGVRATVQRNRADDEVSFSLWSRTKDYGSVRINGHSDLAEKHLEAVVQAQQMAIAPFQPLLPSALFVKDGHLTGQISITKEADDSTQLDGAARLNNLYAWAKGEPNPVTDAEAQLTFDDQTVQVDEGTATYGWVSFNVAGHIHSTDGVQLQAQAKGVDANDFMATFNLAVPVPVEGTFQTDNLTATGKLGETVFAGTVTHDQPLMLDQVAFDAVRTDFILDKRTDILTLINTTATPSVGGQIVGNARIRLGDVDDGVITARAEGISADAIAQIYGMSLDDAQFGQLSASTQISLTDTGAQTQLSWELDGDYPASGVLATVDDQLTLQDTAIQVGEARIAATGALTKDQWHTTLHTDGMAVASVLPDLDGVLSGQVTVSGQTNDIRLAAIHADGALSVAEIHPVLAEPLDIAFNWQGDRLQIQQATSSGVVADGWIQPSFTGQALDIADMALNLKAQDIDLSDFAASLPIALPVPVEGQSQFAGQLTGTLDEPQLNGQLQFTDFAIGAIAFDSVLSGPVSLEPEQALNVALAGEQDSIQITGNLSALEVELQRNEAIAHGQLVDRRFIATLQDIPLALFHDVPALNHESTVLLSTLNGDLSGEVMADWHDTQNPTLLAELAIANPMVGTLPRRLRRRHRGDRLTGTLHYRDGLARITDGQLQFGQSRLQLSGQADTNDRRGPVMQGHIDIERGAMEDILTLVRAAAMDAGLSSTFMAFADRATPSSTPIESFEDSLDISAFMEAPQAVEGHLSGAIGIKFSSQDDAIQVEAGLEGHQLQVGPFGVDHFRLDNGQLSPTSMAVADVQLMGLSYGEMQAPEMTLRASIDSAQQTGQVQITQVPLATIGRWVNSPVSIDGEFGAIAHWQQTGTLPNMSGSLSFNNP